VGKRFTPAQRADAMAITQATGGPIAAARTLGANPSSVNTWMKDPEKAAPLEVREAAKRDLLQALDNARWKYLTRLTEDAVVNKESGYYASQSFKILNEQHQLLSGGPTARFSLADYLKTAMQPVEGEFKELKAGAKNAKHPST
jgi:hypothetical protein